MTVTEFLLLEGVVMVVMFLSEGIRRWHRHNHIR